MARKVRLPDFTDSEKCPDAPRPDLRSLPLILLRLHGTLGLSALRARCGHVRPEPVYHVQDRRRICTRRECRLARNRNPAERKPRLQVHAVHDLVAAANSCGDIRETRARSSQARINKTQKPAILLIIAWPIYGRRNLAVRECK